MNKPTFDKIFTRASIWATFIDDVDPLYDNVKQLEAERSKRNLFTRFEGDITPGAEDILKELKEYKQHKQEQTNKNRLTAPTAKDILQAIRNRKRED